MVELYSAPMFLGLRLFTDQEELALSLCEYCGAGSAGKPMAALDMLIETKWPGLVQAVVLCRKDLDMNNVPARSVVFVDGQVQVFSEGVYGFQSSEQRRP